jgi:hypothetical protein
VRLSILSAMGRFNYKTVATLQLLLTALAVTAFSGQAAAQDPPDPVDPAAPVVEEAAAPTTRYPRAVIDRPLTLPQGIAALGVDFAADHDFGIIGATAVAAYGLSNDFEALLAYGLTLEPGEAKGPLALDLGYKLLRGALGGKFEMIARARGTYNFLSEVADVKIGLHAQYNATPKLAFISGVPGTEHLKITLATPEVLPGVEAPKPIDFTMPFGIGFQATPEFYLQLDTALFTVDSSDSASTVIFDDVTPLSLTAVYNVMPALDVQALIGFTNLTPPEGVEAADTLNFLLGFRYYAGTL